MFSAEIIADYLKGAVEGDPSISVSGVARIEQGKPGTLCFFANPKYEKHVYTTKASIILLNRDYELKDSISPTIIRVDNAYEGIASVLGMFESAKLTDKKGIEWPSKVSRKSKRGKNCYVGAFAVISKGVRLGNNVKIYPQSYIGDNVTIGDNTIIYSGVKIYHGCVVGSGCIIHSGCVIGADGFGFARQADGEYKKIPQIGNVVIEDNVEIGACTTIDRSTMGSTLIRSGVKLDNLIQIAHNVEIGKNTVMAAQTGIAGSVKIGDGCIFAGQAGVVGHIKIGDNVTVASKTGISNNVTDGKSMLGFPSMEASKYKRSFIVFRNLPDLKSEVDKLIKKVTVLEKTQDSVVDE
ncbi:MAG: UDP-3-O-(3-hydroxymyristoyl)glucosamine N-acyltransferase [Prevotellaceae bacterium]|jgi:UDP-3-O-[3-hydroxymyristoyl] glucosamine N-acyltransferase|nr:UDP-3-O-(3-hydroxymyristoyl)glucosamine N-acyltransferase [Prevotellaceae bacterium]